MGRRGESRTEKFKRQASRYSIRLSFISELLQEVRSDSRIGSAQLAFSAVSSIIVHEIGWNQFVDCRGCFVNGTVVEAAADEGWAMSPHRCEIGGTELLEADSGSGPYAARPFASAIVDSAWSC